MENYISDPGFEPNCDLPKGKLDDFCKLPNKPLEILEAYLREAGTYSDLAMLREEIIEDYEKSKQQSSLRILRNKIIFPCRYNKPDGSSIELTIKPSLYGDSTWFLYYVNLGTTASIPTEPGKLFERFAFFGSWTKLLTDLMDKALDERWCFHDSAEGEYPILVQYIKYTFSRLVQENKICISANQQFAAFNTGLVDDHYDDIYACFVPNTYSPDTPWRYNGFCTATSGGLSKVLISNINPLPAPPSYFSHKEDLFFDTEKPLCIDFEHIIVDNIRRLPIAFLREQLFDYPEALKCISSIEACKDASARDDLYDSLGTTISDDSKLFRRFQNRIKDAIEFACKRVRWNYRTAIPLYFPRGNRMSLMLPLALVDEDRADIALVVELLPSGCYQGQTILTLSQAYINARLVCKLTADWLNPEDIASRSAEGDSFD